MVIVGVILQAFTLVVVSLYTIFTYRLLKAQTHQGFENKFFQLLRFHHDIVDAIKVDSPSGERFSGRPTFQHLYTWFFNRYVEEYRNNPYALKGQVDGEIYVSYYRIYQDALGHYFRNLYHLIKFIDRSSVDSGEKVHYAHLVRAQLSSGELLLLFYNCYSSLGKNKFYPLVEKYALLKNMSQDDLVSRRLKHPTDHKSFYRPCAFGE